MCAVLVEIISSFFGINSVSLCNNNNKNKYIKMCDCGKLLYSEDAIIIIIFL